MTKRPDDLASRVAAVRARFDAVCAMPTGPEHAAAFDALVREVNAIGAEFNTRSDAEPFSPLQQGLLSKRRDDDPRAVSRADKQRRYSAKWYHKYRSRAALDEAEDDAEAEAEDVDKEKFLNGLAVEFDGIIDAAIDEGIAGLKAKGERVDASFRDEVKKRFLADHQSKIGQVSARFAASRADLAARRKARADARAARFAEIDTKYAEDDECDEDGNVPPSPNVEAPPGYKSGDDK
jgi:hypothetical protein